MRQGICDICKLVLGVKNWHSGWWVCEKCWDEMAKRHDDTIKETQVEIKEEHIKQQNGDWFT